MEVEVKETKKRKVEEEEEEEEKEEQESEKKEEEEALRSGDPGFAARSPLTYQQERAALCKS